jgi:predicted deacylase
MPATRALADAFAAPFRLPTKPVPRSFRHTAAKRDIPVIVYEAGRSMKLDEDAIEIGIAGIRRVMKHAGMCNEAPAAPWSIHLQDTRWMRAKRAGLFRCLVSCGDHVLKGQPVAQLTDPFDTFLIELRAPVAGYVITVNEQPVVNQGDVVLRLGMT